MLGDGRGAGWEGERDDRLGGLGYTHINTHNPNPKSPPLPPSSPSGISINGNQIQDTRHRPIHDDTPSQNQRPAPTGSGGRKPRARQDRGRIRSAIVRIELDFGDGICECWVFGRRLGAVRSHP